ncbi:hypothetical protein KIN20_033164 [Parelaphostrongylus tenuis]|nr:hypothetical protein KIN20_033164 [Parelaphostrongylus tenuis]
MTTFFFFSLDVSSNSNRNSSLNVKEYHDQTHHSTPLQISLQHGDYIAPTRSPNGEFQPTTRHFYSY